MMLGKMTPPHALPGTYNLPTRQPWGLAPPPRNTWSAVTRAAAASRPKVIARTAVPVSTRKHPGRVADMMIRSRKKAALRVPARIPGLTPNRRKFLAWFARSHPDVFRRSLEQSGLVPAEQLHGLGIAWGSIAKGFSTFVSTAANVAGQYLSYEQQKDLMKEQIRRARADRPPIQAEQYRVTAPPPPQQPVVTPTTPPTVPPAQQQNPQPAPAPTAAPVASGGGIVEQVTAWVKANPLPAAGIAAAGIYLVKNK